MDLDSLLASFDGEPGYLDWAAFGPLSPSVRNEVHADAELLGSGRRTGIDLVGEHVLEARELLAELLDADAGSGRAAAVDHVRSHAGAVRTGRRAHALACRVPEPHRHRDPRRGRPRLDRPAVAGAGGRIRDARPGARGDHGRHARAGGEPRRLPHRLPRRPDGTARGHRRSPADRRRDAGVRRRGRRLCGGRRRVRKRLQVAAGRPGHRVRVVQRSCSRAHRARALRVGGHR